MKDGKTLEERRLKAKIENAELETIEAEVAIRESVKRGPEVGRN